MSNKLNVVLDLDETLINSQPLDELKSQERERFMRRFTHHNMDGYYLVCQRPHLQSFLDYLFENHNVSVWTAASHDYANFVINNVILIKPNRTLKYFFWDKHCKTSRKQFNKDPKNLKLLWNIYKCPNFYPDNTFIIDDLDDVYKPQKCNSIPAIPPFDVFDTNSDNDRFLQELIPKIEQIRIKRDTCLTGACHLNI